MAFTAVVLVVLGLGMWAIYRLTTGGEQHSFARGGAAPTYVQVTAGKRYSIGVRDGVRAIKRLGIDPARLACGITPTGGQAQQLTITADADTTKAVNQVATFVAPLSGRVHIDCPGLIAVFVDNADDAGTDPSGWWLVLATIALATGLPLLLSVLRGQQREYPTEPR